MSTEWFISAFKNKEPQNIPIKNVLEIFSAYKIKMDNNCIILELHNGTIDIYLDLTENTISDLMISRPLRDKKMYRVLFKIMSLGNFILFAPDGNYPIILDKYTEHEFPDDMIEVLGKPKIAENERKFLILLNEIYK